MSAMHPFPSHPDEPAAMLDKPVRGSLGMRWAALHDAADAVAMIAGETPSNNADLVRLFPARLRERGEYQRLSAEHQIADLVAVMEPGLRALLTVCARGERPVAAAQILLAEFEEARNAILALAPLESAELLRQSA